MDRTFYERYSRFILAVAFVVFPFLVYGAKKASDSNRNDVKDWLPATFDETRDYRWFQSHFENETSVLVSWPGCTLEDPRIEEFARALVPLEGQSSQGVETALFSGVLTGPRVLRTITEPPVDLVRSDAVARLAGLLVGKDGRQTCAVVSLSKQGQAELHHTLDELYRVAEQVTGLPRNDIYMGGPPVDNVAIDIEGQKTLRYLATLSALLGLGLSYWCMRAWDLTFLIFFTAVYSAAIALSLVYFTGGKMDAILYSMPPVVYTAALSGSIHIINYYRNARFECGLRTAPGQGLRRAWLPCMLSAGTTAIGLGSLCLSELVPIRSFGLYASLGVMGTLVLLFLCVPSALQLWPPKVQAPPPPNPLEAHSATRLGRIGMRAAWWIVDHNVLVCVLFGVTLLAFGAGVRWVKTSVSIANLFSPEAQVVRDYTWLEDHLGGLVPMEIVLKFDDRECKLTFLQRLELVDRIQRHVQSLREVSSVMSAPTFTPEPPAERPGKRAKGVAGALSRLAVRNPEHVKRDVFNKQLEAHKEEFEYGDYLSSDGDEQLWRISIRLLGMEDIDYGLFVDEMRREVEPFLAEQKDAGVEGISATYTGVTPVVYKAERALLEGLVDSFFMAFAIMAVVMAIVYRSIPAGLLVMFPNVWPMALIFGLLGYSRVVFSMFGYHGIVIDIGTMMTASVAMGVSVDDAAHYITWFRFGIGKGYDHKTAAIYAYRNAAVAMAQSSIIVGLGLAVFGLSSFVPTQRFGMLMLTLLMWGLFADLVLMPAILAGPMGRFFTHGVKPTTADAEEAVVPAEPARQPTA